MLRMASVGDSVVWGQGLRPEDKFTHIVAREIAEIASPLSVELAHSGGVIGGPPEDPIHSRPISDEAAAFTASPVSGEIPHSLPTVIAQLRALAATTPGIDLIVMDGAANDAGFMGAASPNESDFRALVRKIREVDAPRVAFALEEARRLFPKALIFYTGYYPGLSEESDLDISIDAVQASLIALSGVLAPVVGPIILAIESERAKQRIKRQVQQFHAELMNGVTAQIARHNQRWGVAPVIFVNPGFRKSNAMYGAEPFVHDMHGAFARDVAEQRTDLFWDRVPEAKEEFSSRGDARFMIGGLPLNPGNKTYMRGWMVANAHLAHPNKAGARKYADQLKPRMREQIAFSLREQMDLIGLAEGSLRKAAADRLRLDLNGRSLRGLGGFSRLDCIEVELRTSFVSALTSSRLVFDVDWGDGWRRMESLRGAPGEDGFLDLRGEKALRALTKLRISYDARSNARSQIAGRMTIRINGEAIDNRAFRHRIRNAEDTFAVQGDRRVFDLGLAAPA